MSKIIMYGIIALVIVAALTHPAGAAAGMTGLTNLVTGESNILAGQNQKGGTTGYVSSGGTTYSFM